MRLLALVLTSLAALLLAPAARADSLRCGSKLAPDGATQAEVMLRCGAPMTKLTRYETISDEVKTSTRTGDKTGGSSASQAQVRTITRTIDEWVYNFGPSEFMQKVTFVDGRLVSVQSLGYGSDGTER